MTMLLPIPKIFDNRVFSLLLLLLACHVCPFRRWHQGPNYLINCNCLRAKMIFTFTTVSPVFGTTLCLKSRLIEYLNMHEHIMLLEVLQWLPSWFRVKAEVLPRAPKLQTAWLPFPVWLSPLLCSGHTGFSRYPCCHFSALHFLFSGPVWPRAYHSGFFQVSAQVILSLNPPFSQACFPFSHSPCHFLR